VNSETITYYRARETAERQAERHATCEEARSAHEQMATAYAQLVELEELKAAGLIPAGKVLRIADALRGRDSAEYGRRLACVRGVPVTSARRA
jgi:hypothetical protein